MNSLEKLKKITNYKEKTLDQPTYNHFFVEMITSDDKEYLLELKRQKRDLIVDIILGDKEEEEFKKDNYESYIQPFDAQGISSISPSAMSTQSKVANYTDIDNLYKNILGYIDTFTNSNKKNSSNITTLDLSLKRNENYSDKENLDMNVRKIITRITMCSNLIALEGRIGTAKSMLVGVDNWEYFRYIEREIINDNSGKINGIDIIYESNIEPDKVILVKNNNIDQSGICLFNDVENKKYCELKTTLWFNQFCWFRISGDVF
jgi:hypothetical protein